MKGTGGLWDPKLMAVMIIMIIMSLFSSVSSIQFQLTKVYVYIVYLDKEF